MLFNPCGAAGGRDWGEKHWATIIDIVQSRIYEGHMTTDEAYELTMQAVKSLESAGLAIKITPSQSRTDLELIAKYNQPERVAPEKWVSVAFLPKNQAEAQLILKKARNLGRLGISFDTGGEPGGKRDWELDWSFAYRGVPDFQKEQAQETVEDLIQKLSTEEIDPENSPTRCA